MTRSMSTFFALLTIVADAIFVGSVGTLVWGRFSPRGKEMVARLRAAVEANGLFVAWAIALIATLGSLYYSEIANYTPCRLCWFQRIAMYPQAIILGIAAFKSDPGIRRYVLPIVTIGASISIWHYLLQRFPSIGGSAACDPTAPCTTTWVWQFHFVSIPFMALSGFAAIAVLLYLLPHETRQKGVTL